MPYTVTQDEHVTEFTAVAIDTVEDVEDEQQERLCEYCGAVVDEDAIECGGKFYCDEHCANRSNVYECEYCGDWFDCTRTGLSTGDDRTFCSEDCAQIDGYYYCERCEEWEYGCNDVLASYGYESWCDSCYEYNSRTCVECGTVRPEDDMHYDWQSCNWYCEDCYTDSEQLHEYGYAPSLNFFGEDGGPYLGVELETDGGYDQNIYVRELASIFGFDDKFWMTRDSSLQDGVEITSHPMTLDYHMSIKRIYEGIAETAERFDYVSHDGGRCGIHVHVDREFFGTTLRARNLAGYKLMRLLQRFEHQFTMFSRRRDNSWCRYTTLNNYAPNKDVPDTYRQVVEKSQRMCYEEQNHSQALNFEHDNTFEFRIFRGTLLMSTYFATLALVDGMCRLVKKRGTEYIENVDWYRLVDDIVESCGNKEASELLVSYLKNRGLSNAS